MPTLLGIALTLALAMHADAATKRGYQPGKLLDIGSNEDLVKSTVSTTAVFTVQVGEVIYTTRGPRLMLYQDVGQGLIVGDQVQVRIDLDTLVFLKPDGKEMKTTIMKRAHVQAQ